jgi:3D (Asp-Asp-Asp) domain-containing protein
VSRVNRQGSVLPADAVQVSEDISGDIAEPAAYDFLVAGKDNVSNGFYASARAGLLQPAGGYSASYLSLLGDAANNASPKTSGDINNIEDEYNNSDTAAETYSESSAVSGFETDGAERQSGAEGDRPAYTVKVIYYGDRHVIRTAGKKVSDLFDEHGFIISENDKISGAYLDGFIDSDLYIEITRVTQKTVYEEVKIPAKTVYRDNAELTGGQPKVIRNSADGLKRVEYLITYENGIQASKNAVKEEIISEAVSGIIEQGSTGNTGKRIGKGGVEFSYSGVIDVKCTAYSNSFEDTGKRPGDPAYGITKSGMVAREGIVAVDPGIIPLGTKLYIEILDDSVEDYGFAIAGDTGAKIKGKKVDLFFDAPRETLLRFGVRKAKVYIID